MKTINNNRLEEIEIYENLGLIDTQQKKKIIEIKKYCEEKKIYISLSQVLFNAYNIKINDREKYLLALILVIEKEYGLNKYIDPYGMELNIEWDNKLLEIKVQNPKIRRIKNELLRKGVNLSLQHIDLIYNEKSLPRVWNREEIVFSNKKRKIGLSSICKRRKGRELLLPNVKISKLSGSFFKMDIIERALMIKKDILKEYKLDIPLIHILIALTDVNFIIHAFILGQLSFNKEEKIIESWLGGILLQKIDAKLKEEEIYFIRDIFKDFIEENFLLEWINVPISVEKEILSYYKDKLPFNIIKRGYKVQEFLKNKGIDLSILKILYLRGDLSLSLLVEGILKIIYKISSKEIENITKNLKLLEKDTENKKNLLGKTLELSQEQLKYKKSLAASRIIERLKKNAQKKELKDRKEIRLEKIEKGKIKKQIKENLQEKEEKSEKEEEKKEEIEKKEDIFEKVKVKISKELAEIRKIILNYNLSEEDIINVVWEHLLLKEENINKTLIDIMLEKNIIDKNIYSEIMITPISEKELEVEVFKVPTKIDLELANILIEYNIVPKETVKLLITMEAILNNIGYFLPLDKLLVKKKILAHEMVSPLVEKCKKKILGIKPTDTLGTTLRVERKELKTSLKDTMKIFLGGSLKDTLELYIPKEDKRKRLISLKTALILFCISSLIFIINLLIFIKPFSKKYRNYLISQSKKEEIEKKRNKNKRKYRNVNIKVFYSKKKEKVKKIENVIKEIKKVIKKVTIKRNIKKEEIFLKPILKDIEIIASPKEIKIKGKFKIYKKSNKIYLKIFLWDYLKKTNLYLKKVKLKNNIFKLNYTFNKEIMEGSYYLEIILFTKKDSKKYEWWREIKIGKKKTILKKAKKIKKYLKKILKISYSIYNNLAKDIKKEGKKTKKYRKRINILIKKIKKINERYIFSNFNLIIKDIENFILNILNYIENIESWKNGDTLLPPEPLQFIKIDYENINKRLDNILYIKE